MPDEEGIALHAGDLDEQECQTQAEKVNPRAYARLMALPPAERGERRQDQKQRQRHRESERADEHQITRVQQRQSTLAAQRDQLRQQLPAEVMEEIRTIIRGRRDVELVVGEEALRVGAG